MLLDHLVEVSFKAANATSCLGFGWEADPNDHNSVREEDATNVIAVGPGRMHGNLHFARQL